MPCPSQSSRFNHPDYIRWTVQNMEFFIAEPSPIPILIPLGPKYSPQVLPQFISNHWFAVTLDDINPTIRGQGANSSFWQHITLLTESTILQLLLNCGRESSSREDLSPNGASQNRRIKIDYTIITGIKNIDVVVFPTHTSILHCNFLKWVILKLSGRQ